MTGQTYRYGNGGRGRPSRRKRRGAVLIIVLTAITLLVGLILYVFNLGDQENVRLRMQDAADSAAISGAGWMARSMNVISVNNVTQARLISLISVMDALPLAAEMTIAEQVEMRKIPDALDPYHPVVGPFTPYERDNFYCRGIARIYEDMYAELNENGNQLRRLEEIDEAFDQKNELELEGSYDVARSTEWNAPNGERGLIWRAILALDNFSQAELDTAPVLAQADAHRFSAHGMSHQAFIVPLRPPLPGFRGEPRDFLPVLNMHIRYGRDRDSGAIVREVKDSGLVTKLAGTPDTAKTAREISVRGGATPIIAGIDGKVPDRGAGISHEDFPYYLGPFARLYNWRDYWDQWEWVSSGDTMVHEFQERWGYTTYGPLDHALRQVYRGFGTPSGFSSHWWHWHHGTDGSVDLSRFAFHLRTLAQVKAAYILGLPAPISVQYSEQWITNYDDAVAYVEGDEQTRDGNPDINNHGVMVTRYYRVHIRSTVHPDRERAHWLNPGSWNTPAMTPTVPDTSAEYGPVPRRWWSWQLKGRGPYGNPDDQPLERWVWDRNGWKPMRMDNSSREASIRSAVTTNGSEPQEYTRTFGVGGGHNATVDLTQGDEPPTAITIAEHITGDAGSETVGPIILNNTGSDGVWSINSGSGAPVDAIIRGGEMTDGVGDDGYARALELVGDVEYTDEEGRAFRVAFDITIEKTGTDMHISIKTRKHYVANGASPWDKWIPLDDSGNAWYKKWMSHPEHDGHLGLRRRLVGYNEDTGEPIYAKYTVYHVEWRIFGGIELRNEILLSSPVEGAHYEDLPAPVLLDTDNAVYNPDRNEGDRRRMFMYLGVATRTGESRVWQSKFLPGNPSGDVAAVSQVSIFNNNSWDLWTQDWQAKLVPVKRWDVWCDRLAETIPDWDPAEITDVDLTQEDLERVLEYMQSISPEMAEAYLVH